MASLQTCCYIEYYRNCIYDEIGFNKIPDEILRHLVITGVSQPSSKLATTEYLKSYYDEDVDLNHIYRYMEKGVERLRTAYANGTLSKDKISEDVAWDGLKGLSALGKAHWKCVRCFTSRKNVLKHISASALWLTK